MSNADQPACPVDSKAREAWLRAAASQTPDSQPPAPHPISPQHSQPQPLTTAPLPGTCDSSKFEQRRAASSIPGSAFAPPKFSSSRTPDLSTDRQVSSIPRFTPAQDTLGQDHDRDAKRTFKAPSPNAQSENPITSGEGKWVYPSESQFHSALVRKHGAQNAPPQDTIPNIIPIHNAVNERTWKEILDWERHTAGLRPATAAGENKTESETAGEGPQLVSFQGDSQKLTPRARFRGWVGYQAPFDRHDWVVRRETGEEVEYVIDFYAGKGMGGPRVAKTPLSFYLDVRPKLNSFEGCRMRFSRFWSR